MFLSKGSGRRIIGFVCVPIPSLRERRPVCVRYNVPCNLVLLLLVIGLFAVVIFVSSRSKQRLKDWSSGVNCEPLNSKEEASPRLVPPCYGGKGMCVRLTSTSRAR